MVQESQHEAKETFAKQIEIGLERCMALLRVDWDGETKRTNICFNANFYFLFLKPLLQENEIKIHKKGYVYTSYIRPDNYPAILSSTEADLTQSQEPDPKTLSDGWNITMNDLRLLWSNCTLKLRFEFEVHVDTIDCDQQVIN